ncbi:MAG: TauD/TfdA family dioxygenase [Alcanivoracaceae bacterium]|nr:TauD/TfdA family dioxygenase [Alcanivoracaceae bacterium]
MEASKKIMEKFSENDTSPNAFRYASLPHIVTPADLPIDRSQWKEFVYEKTRELGYIVLRGFDLDDAQQFQSFLEKDLKIKLWNVFNKLKVAGPIITFVRRITDGILGAGDNRSYINSQLQQLGRIENSVQGPHIEGGVYNRRARYLFMFCEQAAQNWGETGVADMHKVFQSLPAATQDALRNSWQQFEFTSIKRVNWLERLILTLGRIKHYLRSDGYQQMVLDYIPFVCEHPETGLPCPQIWAYLGDSVYSAASETFPERTPLDKECMASTWQMKWTLSDRNGTEIPEGVKLMDELIKATFEHSRLIKWQTGDITVVDNIRCAHWRMNGHADQPRKIFQLQAEPYLSTDYLVRT